jgi:protein-glutamine gamma-glutamyltransferase
MSAASSTVEVGQALGARRAPASSEQAAVPERLGVRTVTFAALAGYGVLRWAMLMRPAPTWRLAGLLALSIVLAGGVPLIARRDRVIGALTAFCVLLAAFPVAGLRWHWFVHLQITRSADQIGNGLEQLPNTLVPYLGSSHPVRLVILLGAAVLLLDAAAVLAFAGGPGAPIGDGRRAAAALPLTALAVVPSTLIRPEFPYLQGLLLFALLAAFMWAERIRRQAYGSALTVLVVVGVAAAVAAPHIDQRTPWVNYRAWAGTLVHRRVDRFNWNQTYGPLNWPHGGHEVLTVQAHTADYWKAADLDTFNGSAWVAGDQSIAPTLPPPKAAYVKKWSQTITVTLEGMQTTDVIAAGVAQQPSPIAGGVGEGTDAGTWVAGRELGPGTTYQIDTYSPRPSFRQLATAGRRYPAPLLGNYLTLAIPQPGLPSEVFPQVQFATFHSRRPPSSTVPSFEADAAPVVLHSPYAPAYRLARRLAAQSSTPAAFVAAVEQYLSSARGFTYTQRPKLHRYPLESFLFDTKQGYCQQFSGAMALLLRMGGIPARVASGFTSGGYDSETHRWIVSDTDAHAWVEAWFPGYGWVRFDPTPAIAPARAGQSASENIKGFGSIPSEVGNVTRKEIGSASGATTSKHHARAGGIAWWVIALVAVAAGGLLALLFVRRHFRRRPDDPVDELERALMRTRRPLADGVTLSVLEHRLSTSPGAAAYVRTLSLSRYGGSDRVPSRAERRALRRELARGLGLSGRFRALWALPPQLHGPGQTDVPTRAGSGRSGQF